MKGNRVTECERQYARERFLEMCRARDRERKSRPRRKERIAEIDGGHNDETRIRRCILLLFPPDAFEKFPSVVKRRGAELIFMGDRVSLNIVRMREIEGRELCT